MSLPDLKLVSFSICPYVQRAMIVLREKNVPFDIEYIDLSEPPPWFYDISPLEKVPVLLVDEQPLFESMVICDYLDEITPGSFYPEDPFEKAQNRSWIEFGNEILASTFTFYTTDDEKTFKHQKNILVDRLETLEEEITSEPFFNGESFSMIDAVFAPVFRIHKRLSHYQDHELFEDSENLHAWGERLLQRTSVIEAVPASFNEDFKAYLKKQDSVFTRDIQDKLN